MLKYRKITISLVLVIITVTAFSVIAYTAAQKSLSTNEAQRLLRRVAGLNLPSDAVRVKEISSFGSSAVVVADVEMVFRFTREERGWRVAEVRADDRRWEDLELIGRALNREKSERARAELETLATALESFRRERGFYIPAKEISVLTDHITPHHLARVIQFDPWHRPYRYQATGDGFTLSSDGADGRVGTEDDLVLRNR